MSPTLLSWLLLLLTAPAGGPVGDAAASPAVVKLVVVGRFPAAEVDAVAAKLATELPVQVVRGSRIELPRTAFYPPRGRYRADRLLETLAALAGPGERVLGLTSVDISTTKGDAVDWGVFGLATLGGPSGVISRFRLRRKARGAAQVTHRVAVTAVHETGHMLGLDHCAEPLCVMQDAGGRITNTDTTSGALGPGCAAALGR